MTTVNSSQARRSQPTSNDELDLDALERKLRAPDDFDFDQVDVAGLMLALIQRLREAEQREQLNNALIGVQRERIAALEDGLRKAEAPATVTITGYTNERIAALERVREAAPALLQLVSESHPDGPWFSEPKQSLDPQAVIVEMVRALAAVATALNTEGSNG